MRSSIENDVFMSIQVYIVNNRAQIKPTLTSEPLTLNPSISKVKLMSPRSSYFCAFCFIKCPVVEKNFFFKEVMHIQQITTYDHKVDTAFQIFVSKQTFFSIWNVNTTYKLTKNFIHRHVCIPTVSFSSNSPTFQQSFNSHSPAKC